MEFGVGLGVFFGLVAIYALLKWHEYGLICNRRKEAEDLALALKVSITPAIIDQVAVDIQQMGLERVVSEETCL